MTDSRTLFVRIRAAVPSLRPSERRIAEFVLEHPEQAASLSITDLAEACSTSTTTVVRFTKRLGYDHYRELRIDLTRESTRETLERNAPPEMSSDINRTDTLPDIIAKVAMNETLSIGDTAQAIDVVALETAISALAGASRIDIVGVGASAFVAADLQQKLIRIGFAAFAWRDAHSAWTAASLLDDKAVCIAISHSGTTIDTVNALRIAKESGATTIAITNFGGSTLGEEADILLTTAARETQFRSGALGSRIAQLMVVDCLFIGVAQRAYDESLSALHRTYRAVQSRKLDA
ncbi:MurR/RpiR family transcriptional regulator [Ruicaihuangia caeni]|uniref:MurR/RpiR family transcriptional regulator n=1 Tax=Ruicaihuangia caeni TaxID=3042517 RepID=A0AAW6T5D7_9MICO|nr:MurR/RpiR family transcriptional regulator [Klugiella sp. YN-L-19]MDI2098669.1 MurR/RpiR family transcriptional regulator [Klugiella sp. YN-L-19]